MKCFSEFCGLSNLVRLSPSLSEAWKERSHIQEGRDNSVIPTSGLIDFGFCQIAAKNYSAKKAVKVASVPKAAFPIFFLCSHLCSCFAECVTRMCGCAVSETTEKKAAAKS